MYLYGMTPNSKSHKRQNKWCALKNDVVIPQSQIAVQNVTLNGEKWLPNSFVLKLREHVVT